MTKNFLPKYGTKLKQIHFSSPVFPSPFDSVYIQGWVKDKKDWITVDYFFIASLYKLSHQSLFRLFFQRQQMLFPTTSSWTHNWTAALQTDILAFFCASVSPFAKRGNNNTHLLERSIIFEQCLNDTQFYEKNYSKCTIH